MKNSTGWKPVKKAFISTASLLLIVWLIFIFANTQPLTLRGKAQIGEPYFFRQQKNWFSPILDHCIDQRHIYVLYANDVVECYTLDGQYDYSVFFRRKPNGVSKLHHIESGCVFEDGCEHHFYVISGEGRYEFVRFLTVAHNAYKQCISNPAQRDTAHAEHTITLAVYGSNLYLCSENGIRTAITDRPAFLALLQDRIIKPVIAFLTILTIVPGACFAKQLNSRGGPKASGRKQ